MSEIIFYYNNQINKQKASKPIFASFSQLIEKQFDDSDKPTHQGPACIAGVIEYLAQHLEYFDSFQGDPYLTYFNLTVIMDETILNQNARIAHGSQQTGSVGSQILREEAVAEITKIKEHYEILLNAKNHQFLEIIDELDSLKKSEQHIRLKLINNESDFSRKLADQTMLNEDLKNTNIELMLKITRMEEDHRMQISKINSCHYQQIEQIKHYNSDKYDTLIQLFDKHKHDFEATLKHNTRSFERELADCRYQRDIANENYSRAKEILEDKQNRFAVEKQQMATRMYQMNQQIVQLKKEYNNLEMAFSAEKEQFHNRIKTLTKSDKYLRETIAELQYQIHHRERELKKEKNSSQRLLQNLKANESYLKIKQAQQVQMQKAYRSKEKLIIQNAKNLKHKYEKQNAQLMKTIIKAEKPSILRKSNRNSTCSIFHASAIEDTPVLHQQKSSPLNFKDLESSKLQIQAKEQDFKTSKKRNYSSLRINSERQTLKPSAQKIKMLDVETPCFEEKLCANTPFHNQHKSVKQSKELKKILIKLKR